jgi:two-component system, NarL family, response regulator NreC
MTSGAYGDRAGEPLTPSAADSRTVTVALVEDHHLVREGLRMVLAQRPDIEVVGEAADAAGALRLLETLDPDVVLLDLSLPDSDGVPLIRSLVARRPGMRILVLTMHRDAETVRQAFLAGASGFMIKGAHSDELYAAIRALDRGERYVHSSVVAAIVEDSLQWQQSSGSMSAREREILRLIASGRSAVQIGEILGISPHTVRRHRANLLAKLNVRGSSGLTRYAVEHGLAGGLD